MTGRYQDLGEMDGMRVVVVGAGIIGVTMAYELCRDGPDVIVVDREAEPALFTSYANAGLVAPSHAFAWATPLPGPRQRCRA